MKAKTNLTKTEQSAVSASEHALTLAERAQSASQSAQSASQNAQSAESALTLAESASVVSESQNAPALTLTESALILAEKALTLAESANTAQNTANTAADSAQTKLALAEGESAAHKNSEPVSQPIVLTPDNEFVLALAGALESEDKEEQSEIMAFLKRRESKGKLPTGYSGAVRLAALELWSERQARKMLAEKSAALKTIVTGSWLAGITSMSAYRAPDIVTTPASETEPAKSEPALTVTFALDYAAVEKALKSALLKHMDTLPVGSGFTYSAKDGVLRMQSQPAKSASQSQPKSQPASQSASQNASASTEGGKRAKVAFSIDGGQTWRTDSKAYALTLAGIAYTADTKSSVNWTLEIVRWYRQSESRGALLLKNLTPSLIPGGDLRDMVSKVNPKDYPNTAVKWVE